jgi:hypothetical protein
VLATVREPTSNRLWPALVVLVFIPAVALSLFALSTSAFDSAKIYGADLSTSFYLAKVLLSSPKDVQELTLPLAHYGMPDVLFALLVSWIDDEDVRILAGNALLSVSYISSFCALMRSACKESWISQSVIAWAISIFFACLLFSCSQIAFSLSFGYFSRSYVHFGTQILTLSYWAILLSDSSYFRTRLAKSMILFCTMLSACSDLLFVVTAVIPFALYLLGKRLMNLFQWTLLIGSLIVGLFSFRLIQFDHDAAMLTLCVAIAVVGGLASRNEKVRLDLDCGCKYDALIVVSLTSAAVLICAGILYGAVHSIHARYLQFLVTITVILLAVNCGRILALSTLLRMWVWIPTIIALAVACSAAFKAPSSYSASSLASCIRSKVKDPNKLSVYGNYWVAKRLALWTDLNVIAVDAFGEPSTFAFVGSSPRDARYRIMITHRINQTGVNRFVQTAGKAETSICDGWRILVFRNVK